MLFDLPWRQNWHVLIYQTAIINYVAHLHATLRAHREKTLRVQSQLKDIILNDDASKVMKNIDNNFRLTDILI